MDPYGHNLGFLDQSQNVLHFNNENDDKAMETERIQGDFVSIIARLGDRRKGVSFLLE
jgi:hypothetical protein